jgi:hypothetical protein
MTKENDDCVKKNIPQKTTQIIRFNLYYVYIPAKKTHKFLFIIFHIIFGFCWYFQVLHIVA